MYVPYNWYWFIGDDTGNVWSSARAALVPVDDAVYAAWASIAGNIPVTLPAMADVENVLRGVFPRGTPKSYAADARYRKASGGVIIQSLSPVAFLSDAVSRNTMNSAWDYVNSMGGAQTVNWKMSDGTFVLLDESQITTLVNTVAGFVQSCFTKESELVAGIDGGTITTLDQIDAAFAAISNVYP